MIHYVRICLFLTVSMWILSSSANSSDVVDKAGVSASTTWAYSFQRPHACLVKRIYPCFVDTRSRSELLPLKIMDVFLASKTRLELISATRLRLLQGKLLVGKKKGIVDQEVLLETSSGTWKIQGDALFAKGEDVRTRSFSLHGDVVFQGKSSSEKFLLSQGFENWYQGTSADGRPWMGVMQPLQISKLFSFLPSSLFAHPNKIQKLSMWKSNILEAQTQASDFYKDQVERKIASMEDQQLQQQRLHQQRLQEKKRILKIYRSQQDPDFSSDLKSLSAE